MANDAASIREARRRHILENSEQRLQKITGRSDIISNVTFGNEEGSLDTLSRQTTNGPVQLGSSTESGSDYCSSWYPVAGSYSESQSSVEREQWNTSSTTSELAHQETHVSTPTNLHCLYASRLHLICLAVLVRIMLAVNYGFLFGESLVAPLFLVEGTDILWVLLTKPRMTSLGLLSMVMVLCGISLHKAALISKCIQTLAKGVQDTCIYFFTFITFHAVLEWSKNLHLNS